ncbi:MAG: sigma 54-interacting transcriptional regulator [Myxococcales bacterium]|nr:sigma 54-interacting transcriptional regulator [Myxococcales bacterium]
MIGETVPEAPFRRPAGDYLLVAGEGRLSTHPLGAQVTIGRGDDCDVVIAHHELSRRHVVIRRGPPITVHDQGSMNGTRIGGTVHRGGAPITVAAGDSFQVGPFTVVVIARGADTHVTSPAADPMCVRDPTYDGVSSVIREFAASVVNVLVLGETGVGKEVLAETLHRWSGRKGQLVRINCAALSAALLEAELFGHEKGAFTGATGAREGLLEAAHGGTVFLDEIGELPLDLQAKLLRAVEHREVVRIGATRPVSVDVRFIAATNRDLNVEVEAGRFRRDLFFRLDGISLTIPPLRERRDQIGALALRFLAAARERTGRGSAELGAETLAALEAYHWPGNVRELKAVLERAVLLARGGDVLVKHLVFSARPAAAPVSAPAAPPVNALAAPSARPSADAEESFGDLTDEQRAERREIVRALEECSGNQTRAAKRLGISRTTLVNKIGLYRIPRPRS